MSRKKQQQNRKKGTQKKPKAQKKKERKERRLQMKREKREKREKPTLCQKRQEPNEKLSTHAQERCEMRCLQNGEKGWAPLRTGCLNPSQLQHSTDA